MNNLAQRKHVENRGQKRIVWGRLWGYFRDGHRYHSNRQSGSHDRGRATGPILPPSPAYQLHQVGNLHVQRLCYALKCLKANFPLPQLQLADVRFAQLRMRSQIDLPPSTLTTQVAYLSAEPDGDVCCHPPSIGLFCR